MSRVIQIGEIEVSYSFDRDSYFKIKGQSKLKKRALVNFGGVFMIKNLNTELKKLGFYNIIGYIDDFSIYVAEISFKDLDKLKIVRKF